MGSDYFENSEQRAENLRTEQPDLGIGRECLIDGAIIDKNARIGDGVSITNPGKIANLDGEGYYIRDGIVVVPKGGMVPSGTRI